ncbi:MAG: hypothetical protein JXN59_18050 [Anaerolineae bacterium]|nr:hypothetical protein [Anaerolineae bacterium]
MLLLTGLALLAGCAPGTGPDPTPQPSRPYTHPSGVFSLELPPTWLVGDLSSGPALHVTFAPAQAARPLFAVTVLRFEGALDDTAYGATMGAYLRAPHNRSLDIIETAAMEDGSWRATAVRNAQGEALPVNIFMQRDGPFFSALEVSVPAGETFTLALLSLMTNSFRVNPAAEWPVGTLADLPPGDENLILAGGNLSFGGLLPWAGADGTFHITGLVANHAPYALQDVQVTAQLLDGAGAVLQEQAAAVPLSVLLDGEQAPFDVVFAGGWPRLARRYQLQAEGAVAGAALGGFYGPAGFEWEDQAEYDAAGQLHVRGRVWNTGTASIGAVQALVTVFDGQDRVVGVVTAPVGEMALAPGESRAFDVPLDALGGDAIRYQLMMVGQRG